MHGRLKREENGIVTYAPIPAWKHLLILVINFLGFFGVLLILYGVIVIVNGQNYPTIEKYATLIANWLTLLGVLLTAISVYLGPNMRQPDPFSKKISAPIVICALVCTCILLLFTQIVVPTHVINGFALLGLSGGLFRTISR